MQKFLPFYNIKLVNLDKEVIASCQKADLNNSTSFMIDVVMNDAKNNGSLINYQQWECNNLLIGNIHLDKSLSGKHRPHEVLYDKNRVSFTKGCFRGQEVIARVEYRSKKRIEVKLNAESHPPKNKKIVSKLGDICIELFQNNSIGTVMKHIPGHGLAKVDSHHFTPVINKNLDYLLKNDFFPFKRKNSFFAMTAHIIFKKIDLKNTVTHSKKMIKLIRYKIGFKNILISDDISMKSLKGKIKENTINAFNAGCDLVLHCNAKENEMEIVAQNSPFISKFVIKKTSQFYKIIS